MKKVRLNDMEVIVGVEWTALPPELPEKKALAEYMAKSKAKRGLVIKHQGVTVVGRVDKKTGSVPSASALLAFASQKSMENSGVSSSDVTSAEHNWIVIASPDDSEDLFWMGAVKNGVPIPGSDILGSKNNIIEEVLNLVSNNPNFTIFTTDKDIRFNVLGHVQEVSEKRFSEIVRDVPAKKAALNLFSIALVLAVVIILITLFLGASWFAYSKWDEKQKQVAAARSAAATKKARAAQQAADAKKYEGDVRNAVLKGLDEGMADVEKSLQSAGPYNTVVAWRDIIYGVDIDQAGWQLDQFECILEENIPKCTVMLKRGDLGINKLLLDIHPDAVIEGDGASYIVAGPVVSPRPSNLQVLGSSTDFSRNALSDLQMLRSVSISHEVGASKEVTKEVKIPAQATALNQAAEAAQAAPEPPKPVNIQLGFGSGVISIKGDEMWMLSGMAKSIDSPSLRAKDMQVKYMSSGKMNWVLNVDYIVRTLPQPVIPVIKIGEDTTIVVRLPEKYISTVEVDGEGVSESKVGATNPVESDGGQENKEGSAEAPDPVTPVPAAP